MKLCGFEVGNRQPFFLIAGTCVIESEAMTMSTAETLKKITQDLGIPFIYKSSFDKANRSSGNSYRGLGMAKGLEILAKVKAELELPHSYAGKPILLPMFAGKASPSILKKGSFSLLGICSMWRKKPKQPVISRLCCVSAAPLSVITIWFPICVRWR